MMLKFMTEVHGIPLIKHYVSHQMRSNIDEKVFTVLGDFMWPLATYEPFNQILNDQNIFLHRIFLCVVSISGVIFFLLIVLTNICARTSFVIK